MADVGAVWSLQPFVAATTPAGEAAVPKEAKIRLVWEGTDNAYMLAARHGVPTGFGTDILFAAKLAEKQNAYLAHMRTWYTPARALKQATSDNAFILGMSGPRDPYPGALGIIQRGDHADMLWSTETQPKISTWSAIRYQLQADHEGRYDLQEYTMIAET